MADQVTIQNPDTLEQRVVSEGAAAFFVNQGYQVLDKTGRVNAAATKSAATSKES